MSIVTSLSTPSVVVAPGGTVTVEVTVRNTGTVVDEFRVEVLGAAADWAQAAPEVVPLFPGASAPVIVTFSPPRTAELLAGPVDVPIKVVSREDPSGSSVEELVITIGAFVAVEGELIPRTVRGARSGRAQIAVDNHGNERVSREISVSQADRLLRFEHDKDVTLEAGRAAFIDLKIRPQKTFLSGMDRSIPYRVTLTDGSNPFVLDGTFVQGALLPKWLKRLLLMLLLGLIALAVLWQVALKPVIRSESQRAATKQVDQAAQKAADQTAVALGVKAPVPGAPTTVPSATPGKATTKPPGAPTATTAPTAGTGTGAGASGGGDDGKGGVSTDKRLEVEAGIGETKAAEWDPAGEKGRFSLTDVVFQNPRGDTGLIRLKRGDDVLFESALENFRDLDFHFIAPYIVEGKKLILEVECANPAGAQPCKAAATLSGYLAAAPK